MDSLQGAVAIVTGASGGFGREISQQLAAEGVKVVAAALPQDEAALGSLVDQIKSSGGTAVWRPLDVRHPDECTALVNWAESEMGGLHILVNSAGLAHWVPVEGTSDTQWLQTIEVNLNGTFF